MRFVELETHVAQEQEAEQNQEAVEEIELLRPQHATSADTWLTAGVRALMKSSGKLYHEVVLGVEGEPFEGGDPQIGWLTERFQLGDFDGNGVGDDEHGWAADGVRKKAWHRGEGTDATWSRSWRGGDVIGLAVDIGGGKMRFSLNGMWENGAEMSFDAAGQLLFPAVSAQGYFAMNVSQEAWRFLPPSDGYEEWGNGGALARPVTIECRPSEEAGIARAHT